MLTIVSHARRGDDAPASLASKQGSRHAGSHSSSPPPRHDRHQQDPSASGARARTRGDGAPATIGAHTRAPARRRNVPARRRPSRRRYQPTTCTRCAPASLPRLRHTPERSRTPAPGASDSLAIGISDLTFGPGPDAGRGAALLREQEGLCLHACRSMREIASPNEIAISRCPEPAHHPF